MLTIEELSSALSISKRKAQFYTSVGLFNPVNLRGRGKRCFYREYELQKFKYIDALMSCGITIDRIVKILKTTPEDQFPAKAMAIHNLISDINGNDLS
jgi:DNA-binding transcriptional MerR regulator